MAEKTKFSEAGLVEILAGYHLGELTDFRPFPTGTVQTNILLQTTRGKFVFRCYENRPLGSVRFETNVIRFLRNRQFPCPALYANKHGTFVGEFNGKPFVIFEFVEGEHVENPSEDQKRQLIQKVAELHTLTRQYRPAGWEHRWNYGVDLCRELARQEAGKIGTEKARKKLAWLENALNCLWLPKSLPKGVCHCDFHFSNVLFRDGKFSALIDFDDANYTYLVFDLVGLIEGEAWRHDRDRELAFDRAKKVVDIYGSYRTLSQNEKRHLFDVYKLSILFDCIWFFRRGEPEDFYEKRKIDFLNGVGRDEFYRRLFPHSS